jgi:hypothetical protein
MKLSLIALLAGFLCLTVAAAGAPRATFDSLRPKLASSPFGRPLVLESSEEGGRVRVDVFALVARRHRDVSSGLDTPADWCEVLILHPNVKTCIPGATGSDRSLRLTMGTKRAERDAGRQHIDFRFSASSAASEPFEILLQADEGPLGTRDYRLSLAAVPTAAGQTFLHLGYSCTYSAMARLAMNTYLHTAGRAKVGFTVVDHAAGGEPEFVRGARGALERNTMRYFLAIEAYLASAAKPAPARRAWRLASWYDATEKYARQLHELTKAEYLAGKASGDPGNVSDSADTL